ncbi:tripartite tricarboxylate transporter substrate binding protein [Cupriavidus basilensis]|uniref:tripartite tricarboxylate transporter substrate binding protein n=1 Tax=Cupriavidus basilensis TaxID=68895 RepID=UPI002845C976|nr:tripartite tricarboxylate transporter substrate binding protein [Cupriavidus basilensis]MDR3382102.1 tripartite tricarboxylate transporter substrate binding protein [Cupriavidus basilensis]
MRHGLKACKAHHAIHTLGALLLFATGVAATPARAEWPSDHPIQVYAGFAAGGGTDTMARTMAPFIQRYLGANASLVVQNKPGAAGEISSLSLMRAAPDGYTIGVVNLPAMAFSPLYRKTSFDPAALRLVARVLSDPTILVTRKDSPYNNLKDVVAALKMKPASLSFGHNGIGTNGHLALLQLQNVAGVKVTDIPFNGTAQSKTALFGGHIDLAAVTTGELQDAGKEAVPLKIIAQMGEKRAASLPDVPTAREQGFDDVMPAERGIAVPAGVPPAIVEKLRAAIRATLKDPEYLKKAGNDAPVLAYLPGDDWAREIAARKPMMRKLADGMPKE